MENSRKKARSKRRENFKTSDNDDMSSDGLKDGVNKMINEKNTGDANEKNTSVEIEVNQMILKKIRKIVEKAKIEREVLQCENQMLWRVVANKHKVRREAENNHKDSKDVNDIKIMLEKLEKRISILEGSFGYEMTECRKLKQKIEILEKEKENTKNKWFDKNIL